MTAYVTATMTPEEREATLQSHRAEYRAFSARIQALEHEGMSFDEAQSLVLAQNDYADSARAVNVVDYTTLVPKDIPWIVYPLVYTGGVTLIAGEPKAGKSTLAAQLQRARETGEPFLGQPVVRGPVLLVTEEGGVAVTHKTKGLTKLDIYDRRAAGVETFNDTLNEIGRWVDAHPGGIVFIDTLSVWAGIVDENNASEVTKAISMVMRLAQTKNVAIVLIHHARKTGGDDGKAIRGSGAILAMVDIAAELKRAGAHSDERYLDVMGRVILPDRLLLGFERATATYSPVDQAARRYEGIEDDLSKMPEDGDGVVVKDTGLTKYRLGQLVDMGRVRKAQRPGKPTLYWAIPPAVGRLEGVVEAL
ncbi:MAG: AAA family ATPase [Candidatus Limnocylindrales bacterium]